MTKVGTGGISSYVPTTQGDSTGQVKKQRSGVSVGALQVGFTKDDGGKSKVVQDGARVQNPILDGDEELPAFEERGARAMSDLATKMALQFEDFASMEDSGGNLNEFAQFLLNQNVTPSEEGVEQLQNLAGSQNPVLPDAAVLEQLSANLQTNFGIELPADTPYAQIGLIAGMATAGVDVTSLLDAQGNIDPNSFAQGMQSLLRDFSKGVLEAANMSSGVDKEISLQRTMIFNR